MIQHTDAAMIHSFMDADSMLLTAVGLVGVLYYFLVKFADPEDDSLGATLSDFRKHGRTIALSVVGYLLSCLTLHAAGELNLAAAIGAGISGSFTVSHGAGIFKGVSAAMGPKGDS